MNGSFFLCKRQTLWTFTQKKTSVHQLKSAKTSNSKNYVKEYSPDTVVSVFLCKSPKFWSPMWVREHCRISPPRLLAECCKRQLNQGSFFCYISGCLLFLICIEFVYLYFAVLFCLSVSVKSLPSVLWHCWLGDRKGIRPLKTWAVGCWHGYLFGARCRLAYGPADSTATHCLLLQ